MSLEDHRKPNGNYDGIGVMAEVTGLPRDEIRALAEQVKANSAKLRACPWHEFEQLITAPPGAGRYRCTHCQGEIDVSAYHWHQQGRRPMPVPEPAAPTAYLCEGGPLHGQMHAEPRAASHFSVVQRDPWEGAPGMKFFTATYRLANPVGAGVPFWRFEGWSS